VEAVLAQSTGELRRASAALTTADRPLRVALMGGTMAGKSTLFEALTGGDGRRIGNGAHRTTREPLECPLSGLADVTLVDTPGVGAKDGPEDYLRAIEAMLDCGLVLWVASNDSTQQETAQALVTIADVGKPLWLRSTADRASALP
jgi:predicted GTPase